MVNRFRRLNQKSLFVYTNDNNNHIYSTISDDSKQIYLNEKQLVTSMSNKMNDKTSYIKYSKFENVYMDAQTSEVAKNLNATQNQFL